jgi:hypothetical protein
MFFTIAIGFNFLWNNHTNLTRFAMLAALFTGIVTMHKSRQYIMPFLPYLLLMITLTFKAISEGRIMTVFKEKKINAFVIYFMPLALFIGFVLVSNYFNLMLANQKFSPDSNRQLTAKYAGERSQEMNVVAPMSFIFNEINHFNRIQSEMLYKELNKGDSSISGDGFLQKASEFDIDLVMLSPYYIDWLQVFSFQIGETHGNYVVIDKDENKLVLKRKSE